jgi:hypothetical protein
MYHGLEVKTDTPGNGGAGKRIPALAEFFCMTKKGMEQGRKIERV